ncbi:hypothetical protein D3C75_1358970 [compost metagenome]
MTVTKQMSPADIKRALDIETQRTYKPVLTDEERAAGDRGFLQAVAMVAGIFAAAILYGRFMA